MIFYIVDTTVNPSQDKMFKSYSGVVDYLDGMCQREYKQTHKERTNLLTELGHGDDDYNSTLFVRSMQDKFDIGVVREGRKSRCDITTIVAFQKVEYGD